jgi:dolichyl-phosphate-mannose--protein O-mannosyl transferase
VVLLASLLRLFDLGFWRQLLFDESYYVKDAISIRYFGSEQVWTKADSDAFASGELPTALNQPELISHPQLGKLLISLGFDFFGPTNPFGWRITSALAGILSVLLVVAIANQLFQSQRLALLAGFFLAVDGTAIAMSRVAMLDSFLALFVLIAFWSYLKARLSCSYLWLAISGFALGCAIGIKWSGLWFALALVIHALATKSSSLKSIALFSGAGIFAYLLAWLPWWVSSNGYDRNYSANPLVSFLKLHVDMFNYNIDYRSSNESVTSAWGWPILWQPTAFVREPKFRGGGSCPEIDGCQVIVSTLGNPLIWWGGSVALLALVWFAVKGLDRRAAVLLVAVAAGWLPWLVVNRSSFQFYAVVIAGFWCIALAWLVAKLPTQRMALIATSVALVSFVFLPYQYGTPQPDWYWQLTSWLPLWR